MTSESAADTTVTSGYSQRYWPVPLARAVVAIVAGVVITFSQDHSPELGLWVFGLFGLVSAIAVWLLIVRTPAEARVTFMIQGAATGVAGIVGVALAMSGIHARHTAVFVFLVAVWAAVAGCLELFAARRKGVLERDWLLVGGLTAVLALVFVILPLGARTAVGLFGAYAIVIGVYLAIGSLSVKWAPQHSNQEQVTAHE